MYNCITLKNYILIFTMAFKTLNNAFQESQQQFIMEQLADYTKFLNMDIENVNAYINNKQLQQQKKRKIQMEL